MGLNINIVTKHDPYYSKKYYFLHENLDYIQMDTFVFNHDYKFWTFLTWRMFIIKINNICSKDSIHVHLRI
jgi:hypothetical protein